MRRMVMWVVALHALIGQVSQAQGFDGHGASPPPPAPSVGDPALGFRGAITGAPTLSVWTAAVANPLVERITDGNRVTDVPVLNDLFGFELGFVGRLTGRVGLGISAPLWLTSDGSGTSGPALGDSTVWVPIALLHTDRIKVGAVPFVLVPTGPEARFLGESGFGAGGLVTGGATM